MKRFQQLLIAAALLLPALSAAPPIPWDRMLHDVVIDGPTTVLTRAGKTYKSKRASLTLTEVTLLGSGISIPRQDVKEVIIRGKWEECCEELWIGTEMVAEAVRTEYFDLGIVLMIIGIPVAAVTLPPALVIQAFRHWTTHVRYKVVP
jgi:hypothetical protein